MSVHQSVQPTIDEFRQLAEQGNVVPVHAQLAADFETPLSAYLKISEGETYGFLLESAESTDKSGRWSIVGSKPRMIFENRGDTLTISDRGKLSERKMEGDCLSELRSLMSGFTAAVQDGAPPFYGGAVGYVSYDAIRQFEPTVGDHPADDLGLPEALFMIADEVLIFDQKLRKLQVVKNVFVDDFSSIEEAYAAGVEAIDQMVTKLDTPLHVPALNGYAETDELTPRSNTTQEEYEDMVLRAKEYIAAGDAFQVVPSQRFETDFKGSPVDLYRALRHVNPSPYMFIIQCENFALVGSSPEVHVKAIDGRIDIRPIAGTRWRGKTPEEDDALADDLLNDPKERAEHVMLIDLARNDVGRIAATGSVSVDDQMIIERYSHVMHIVSNVSGKLADDASSYDVLRSTFPAGTVSGAPKIRAMQIIYELEKNRRNAYAGAVGYFGWDGSHDSCIALRTCLLKDEKAYVQAGAGVVADSDPTYEYEECRNKAKALMRAIALANTIVDQD